MSTPKNQSSSQPLAERNKIKKDKQTFVNPILAPIAPSNQAFSPEIQTIAPCPKCSSTKGKPELTSAQCIHYAKLVCAECDRFVKWLPKPKRSNQSDAPTPTVNGGVE